MLHFFLSHLFMFHKISFVLLTNSVLNQPHLVIKVVLAPRKYKEIKNIKIINFLKSANLIKNLKEKQT